MQNNRELFKSTYAIELEASYRANPDAYSCTIHDLVEVLDRMYKAIDRGSFNKDSQAFKNTCKQLKIKHTYRDIETFLGSQGAPQ
jgi:hypothetical protein